MTESNQICDKSNECLPESSNSVPISILKLNINSKNDENLDEISLNYDSNNLSQEKRLQFGTRFLKDGEDIYRYNAWDNVQWDEEQEKAALEIITKQLKNKISLSEYQIIEQDANLHWNKFYDTHNDKFYKDRNWLFTEFPELSTKTDASKLILEIGCGVGNTIFPILQHNTDPNLHIYCCDFSETAINILKENPSHKSRYTAFVCDITQPEWDVSFELNSIDVVIMIFVLSSIQPEKMEHVLKKIYGYLKPGGLVLFRDYGRYDLSQLRFKDGHCISENFYVRGEKTLVYFFDKGEVSEMFDKCGFHVEQLHIDQRLQLNRKKQLKMYRIWIQGKFKKLS